MSPNQREVLYTTSTVTGRPEKTRSTNGAVNVVQSGTLVTSNYDYIGVTYPDAVTEIYTYKSGGAAGTTVATVTVVYTDSTKANLMSVTKT
jgi:hypothetical protein